MPIQHPVKHWTVCYSIQYKNSCSAASDLFRMFKQPIKFYMVLEQLPVRKTALSLTLNQALTLTGVQFSLREIARIPLYIPLWNMKECWCLKKVID